MGKTNREIAKQVVEELSRESRLKEWVHAERVEATRKVFRSVAQHIESQDALGLLGGGTLRYMIYHRLHFERGDYADLCQHGIWMINLLHDHRDEKTPMIDGTDRND